jgi:hypothetical protein
MESARPLRDVFADLVGDESARQDRAADPAGFLAAHGHADLPDSLVAEAIVNYADIAPAEVAEHLAPFVMAHSPVPLDDLTVDDTGSIDGLDLLATAPPELVIDDEPADADDLAVFADAEDSDTADTDDTADDSLTLDFGHGDAMAAAPALAPDEPDDELDEPDEPDTTDGMTDVIPDSSEILDEAFVDHAGLLDDAEASDNETEAADDDDAGDL